MAFDLVAQARVGLAQVTRARLDLDLELLARILQQLVAPPPRREQRGQQRREREPAGQHRRLQPARPRHRVGPRGACQHRPAAVGHADLVAHRDTAIDPVDQVVAPRGLDDAQRLAGAPEQRGAARRVGVEQQQGLVARAHLRHGGLEQRGEIERGRDHAAHVAGIARPQLGDRLVVDRRIERLHQLALGAVDDGGQRRRGRHRVSGDRARQCAAALGIVRIIEADQGLAAGRGIGPGHREILVAQACLHHAVVRVDLADRRPVQAARRALEGLAQRDRHARQPGERRLPRAARQQRRRDAAELVRVDVDLVEVVLQRLEVARRQLDVRLQRHREAAGIGLEALGLRVAHAQAHREGAERRQAQAQADQRERLHGEPVGAQARVEQQQQDGRDHQHAGDVAQPARDPAEQRRSMRRDGQAQPCQRADGRGDEPARRDGQRVAQRLAHGIARQLARHRRQRPGREQRLRQLAQRDQDRDARRRRIEGDERAHALQPVGDEQADRQAGDRTPAEHHQRGERQPRGQPVRCHRAGHDGQPQPQPRDRADRPGKADREQQVTSHRQQHHRASPPGERGRNAFAADDSARGHCG